MGNLRANFKIKAISVPDSIPDNAEVVQIEHTDAPYGELAVLKLTASDLRNTAEFQDFTLNFSHSFNMQGEFKLFVHKPVSIQLDTITVR